MSSVRVSTAVEAGSRSSLGASGNARKSGIRGVNSIKVHRDLRERFAGARNKKEAARRFVEGNVTAH